jgi:hypothetical protein
LRQANGRRTYGISGDVTVLRRASWYDLYWSTNHIQ